MVQRRDEQEQAMTIKRHAAIGTSDMAAIEAALRQGASRRDLMRWLGAAGLSAATAGIIIGDAGRALAQTPKRGGRIKVASQTSSTADTVDPAKQNNQTDYTRCFTFYNGADATRRQPGAAARARRGDRERQQRHGVDDQAPPRRQVPRRHAAHRRRRRLLAGAPQGSGDGLGRQGAGRADEGDRRQRQERGEDHASNRPTPTCRSCWARRIS